MRNKGCSWFIIFSRGLASHLNIRDLWEPDGTGVEYFQVYMGVNRLQFSICILRFDNIDGREYTKQFDKFTANREIFDGFVQQCKAYYTNESVTTDEMLQSFRGKCGFPQYIPNKPAKYGIKIFAMVDSQSLYTGEVCWCTARGALQTKQ